VVDFVRVEYLTTAGWAVGHAGTNMEDPQRYVDGLVKDRGTYARCVELGEADLAPTGVTWAPDPLPSFDDAPRGKVPVGKIAVCAVCGGPHNRKFECLL